jgi:tetratricopeptide (TPR) repeat protein
VQVASLLRASKEHDAAIAEFESIIAIDSAAEPLDASVKPTPPQLLYVARVALARQASIAHSSVAACLLDVGRVDEAEQRLRLACEYSRRVLGT